MQTNEFHKPVLLETAINFLITDKDGIYFDGTLGGGGYSENSGNFIAGRESNFN